MASSRVQKSAHQPGAVDLALGQAQTSLSVLEVGVDAAEFPQHANPHLKIALVLDGSSIDVDWLSESGRRVAGHVARFSTSVMPAEMPYRTCWRAGGRMLVLSFSADFLRRRDAALSRSHVELRPAWSQHDPLLLHLGAAVKRAHRDGLASQAYLDSAAEVAMTHLLHTYGSGTAPEPEPLLPAGIARVVDFIEAHLGQDLSLARLAAEAGLSTFGFARAFTRAIGTTPHRYVQRRRLDRAVQLLRRTRLPIATIAAELGFSSQAHLTTVFMRHLGVTPARLRASAD